MLYLEICEERITIIRSDMIEKIVIMCKLILELCKFLKWHQAYYINRKTNFIAFFIQLLFFSLKRDIMYFLQKYLMIYISLHGLHSCTKGFFFSSISCYTSMFYEKASALKPYSLCCCCFFKVSTAQVFFSFHQLFSPPFQLTPFFSSICVMNTHTCLF